MLACVVCLQVNEVLMQDWVPVVRLFHTRSVFASPECVADSVFQHMHTHAVGGDVYTHTTCATHTHTHTHTQHTHTQTLTDHLH